MSRLAALAVALALLIPGRAGAQGRWDAPSFMRPGAPAGLTLALTDTDPGAGLGVMALWRNAAAPGGLGFRAGIVEAPIDDVAGLLGLDVSGSLSGPMELGAPEVIWWTGVGVTLDDDVSAALPLGLALGWTARDDGVALMPYAGAHAVLDVRSGPGDDLDLDGVLDLGVDVAFGRGWVLRFGAALGGRDAVGLGIRLPR